MRLATFPCSTTLAWAPSTSPARLASSRWKWLLDAAGPRLVLRRAPSRQLLVPRRPLQERRVPPDAVARLSDSLRRPRRVKPTRTAPSLRDLQRGGLFAHGGADARRGGHRLHDATRPGRRDHHRVLRVTFPNAGAREAGGLWWFGARCRRPS